MHRGHYYHLPVVYPTRLVIRWWTGFSGSEERGQGASGERRVAPNPLILTKVDQCFDSIWSEVNVNAYWEEQGTYGRETNI